MRLRLALIPTFLLFVASCGSDTTEPDGGSSPAQAPTEPAAAPVVEKPTAGSGARIAFARDTIDFGEVWDYETLEGRFEFQNVGDTPLVITDVKPSCGCTPVELARDRFEPGEGEALEVVWNLKGFGHQAKTIAVTSNSVGAPIEMLTIRAEIKPFAKFEPVALRLGELELGKAHTATATLTCVDPDFELLHVASANPRMSIRDAGPTAAGGRIVELTLVEEIPWGSFIASASARIRGRAAGEAEPIEHQVILQVSASMLGDLRITPQLLAVGRVAPGAKIAYEVQLRTASGSHFEVTAVRVENSQPPGMTARVESNPDGSKRLLLEGESGDYLGLIRGWVLLSTDVPGEEQRRLSVMGIVRE